MYKNIIPAHLLIYKKSKYEFVEKNLITKNMVHVKTILLKLKM